MPASTDIRRGSASAPGACGELAQGMLNGVVCMVTCPIDMRSTATVELSPGDGTISAPSDSPKASQAVLATLNYLGETGIDADLRLDSRIPRGKGMASSTADVSAAIVATANAAGHDLAPAQIAEIALGVEPSDGVMFPDIVVFDHREGNIFRSLGPPPPMQIVVVDFGGVVDTLEFNRAQRDTALSRQALKMAKAVALIETGMRHGDPALIGKGATISAVANQDILFNPHLDAVLELSKDTGALGVNVAHSGTVIGMLFPDNSTLAESAATLAWRRFPCLESVMQCRVTGGGVNRL